MGLDLWFTDGEYCGVLRRLPLSARIRAYLREKFRRRGVQAALAKYLSQSPSAHRPLTTPEVSMMFQTGTRGIDIDTLEDIAAFLKEPLSAILGIPDASSLSAEEQRIVHAFRVLQPSARDHLVAIAEQLSIQARFMEAGAVPSRKRVHGHGASIPATTAERLSELAREFTHQINAIVADDAGGQAPPTRAEVPPARPVHRAAGRSDVEEP